MRNVGVNSTTKSALGEEGTVLKKEKDEHKGFRKENEPDKVMAHISSKYPRKYPFECK